MWRNLSLAGLAGFLPLLANMAVNLWERDAYGFFPLAWGAAVVLWWRRLRGVERGTSGNPILGVLAFGAAGLLMAGAVKLWSPWLAVAGLTALMAAISWHREGARAMVNSALPLLLILLTLPPPVELDKTLLLRLKEQAVGYSSHFLDLLGIVHARSGVVIEMPGMQMLVEEACSGINSLMAVVAMALFLVIVERRSWWHALLVMAFAVGVVVAANTARITFGGWAWARRGWDVLHGTPHTVLGAVLFALEVVFVLSFDRFLCFFTIGIRRTAGGAVVPPTRRGASTADAGSDASRDATAPGAIGYLPKFAVVALVLLGAASVTKGAVRWRAPKAAAPSLTSPMTAAADGNFFKLPDQLAGWEQVPGVEQETIEAEVEGLLSDRWRFRSGSLEVTIAMDYPFTHYHDLAWCYEVAGWTRTARVVDPPLLPELPGPAHLSLTRRGFERAEILFSSVNEKGVWQDNERMLRQDERHMSFWQRLLSRIRPPQDDGDGLRQFRVQLYWKGVAPLLLDDRRRMQQLFEAACLAAAARITAPAETPPAK